MNVTELTQTLIRCPSVTPADAGAMQVVEDQLHRLGFKVERLRFGAIENIYARLGSSGQNFCFAGHTDVVPAGDVSSWQHNPFASTLADSHLYGRGAVDMKGAIAAFICAVEGFLQTNPHPKGSISLLITGDEEGEAVDGTRKVLAHLQERGEKLDMCLVGEPSSQNTLGDMIKIGRRGSLSASITLFGSQGHSAYPERADNPVPKMAALCQQLAAHKIDAGNAFFQPSTLVLTAIETGNPASNVIPEKITVKLNIRFNNEVTRESLIAWLHSMANATGARYEMTTRGEGEAFIIPDKSFAAKVSAVVEKVTGQVPRLDTLGGTSDARFIRAFCPVLEFGLVGRSMHKVDEHVAVADLQLLQQVYHQLLQEVLG